MSHKGGMTQRETGHPWKPSNVRKVLAITSEHMDPFIEDSFQTALIYRSLPLWTSHGSTLTRTLSGSLLETIPQGAAGLCHEDTSLNNREESVA